MARDRRAALIVQAAARGIVDFSKYKPFDRHWWLRLSWLLNELESDNLRQILTVQHQQHCGALEYTAGRQAFDHHWQTSAKLLNQIIGLYFPWEAKDQHLTKQEEYVSLRQQWINAFGDPADPETKAKIKRTCEFLRNPPKKPEPRAALFSKPKAHKEKA